MNSYNSVSYSLDSIYLCIANFLPVWYLSSWILYNICSCFRVCCFLTVVLCYHNYGLISAHTWFQLICVLKSCPLMLLNKCGFWKSKCWWALSRSGDFDAECVGNRLSYFGIVCLSSSFYLGFLENDFVHSILFHRCFLLLWSLFSFVP